MNWTKELKQVIDYIEDNLTKPIKYELLSHIAGCSVHEFSRLFSFIAGVSVSEYIRRRRLSHAVYDIQNSNERIINIAMKYCYESPTTFTRAFKALFGVSPIQARKTGVSIKTHSSLSLAIKANLEHLAAPKIVKCYMQRLPSMRFAGKRYSDADRVNGGFGECWDEWITCNRFDVLKHLRGNLGKSYEDADGYIAYMRYKKGEPFEYCIGMFLPENTIVPEGFTYIDIAPSLLGVCWVQGREPDIYMQGERCQKYLEANGFSIKKHKDGAWHGLERYVCPRNTSPNADGDVIVDICYFLEGENK